MAMSMFQKICTITALLPEESFRYEDGRQALICDGTRRFAVEGAHDDAFFVRLQSWSVARRHPILDSLRGKRVRVTIEVQVEPDDEEDDSLAEDPLSRWPAASA